MATTDQDALIGDEDIIICPTCNQLVTGLLMAVNKGGVCLTGVPCGHFYPVPPDFHVFLEAAPPDKQHYLMPDADRNDG